MSTNLTTVKKVGLGFALLTLVLIAAVATTIWQVARTQETMHRIVNESSPMTESSLRVINGVNYAVSQLRGWIILGEERFKVGRASAWSDWLDPSMADLKRLVEQSGTQAQKDQIKQVEERLKELREYQKEAESIARSESNFPATELFMKQAHPKSEEIAGAIAAMIEVESKSEVSTERKQLFHSLADFSNSFARAISSVRQFLLLGSEAERRAFQAIWQENLNALDQIEAHAELLTGAQVQQWPRIKSLRKDFEPLILKVLDLRQADTFNVVVAYLRDRGAVLARQTRDLMQKFISELEPQNQAHRRRLTEMTSLLTILEWSLLGIGILLSVGLATLIIRDVESSINTVLAATQEVATSSTEISTGSQQQVSSLNQTAASLNEITATAEEFKVTMQEFADRARAVQEAAVETAQRSTEGRSLAQLSAARIEQVRSNSQATAESVLNLAEQMQRIGEITASVNEIAEQTKLLSLNASIEAARAGEEGRGFAVVATQVRELANQSKEAAGRIESLIGGTQKSMQDVVGKIEDGGRLADQSSEIVRNMTDSFEKIAGAITQTTAAMAQITTGARQQEQGIAELVGSITEIDSASKESLAASEQTLRAIMSIDRQIKRLNETMTAF